MSAKQKLDKLLAVARKMAREYDALCSAMQDHYGCEGCPLNSDGDGGDGCKWCGDMYGRMEACGVLEEE